MIQQGKPDVSTIPRVNLTYPLSRSHAQHNAAVYIRQKAYSAMVPDRAALKRLELAWGANLLLQGSRRDFKTSFPLPEEEANSYNQGRLLDGLGTASVTLAKLQSQGLVG